MKFLIPVLAVAAPLLIACVARTESEPTPIDEGPTQTPSPTQPMIVAVDTNQTMTAKGGAGVGVFVEYRAGGHWHVWMTCDTTTTDENCNFDINMTPASGAAFRNVVASDGSAQTLTLSQTAKGIEATALMTTEVNGVNFDGDPNAPITIDASVSGLHTGDFFFFIQDGKVNGGFTGQLTNPLTFQPSAP